jgi:zinc transporter ZupT
MILNNNELPLPLLSVIIGYIAALIIRPKNKTNLKLLLAFSGSFLLSLTVMHLLPEIYESKIPIFSFIMLGILFKSSWSFSPKEQNTDMYTDTKK